MPQDISDSIIRADAGELLGAIEGALVNSQTGMGTARGAFHQTRVGYAPLLREQELRSLYRGNWLIRRIIDTPAMDMTRRGVHIKLLEGGDSDSVSKVMAKYGDTNPVDSPFESEYSIDSAKEEAIRWARLFGRAYIVVHVNKGEDPAKPIKQVRSFDGVTVLDRYQLMPALDEINVFNPTYYSIAALHSLDTDREKPLDFSWGQRIHRSRVLRYDGNRIHPSDVQLEGDGGHDSVIQGMYETFVRYYQTKESVAEAINSFSLFVATINDLASILTAPNGQAKLKDYIQTLNIQRSVYRTVVKDGQAGDTDFVERSFQGVAENVEAIAKELTASGGLPFYKIWGHESNNNALSTGGTESRAYAEQNYGWQMRDLYPNDRRLFKMLFQSETGEIPERFEIEYPSIYVPTPSEVAEINESKSKTLMNLISAQIITPLEAKLAVATGQELESVLKEKEIREQLEAASADEPDERIDDKYSHIDFTPPKTVVEAFKRAVRALDNGDINPGDGLEAATIREARSIARGERVTSAKVRKAYRWFARNKRFKNEPKDSSAWAAWVLWGGRSGQSFFNGLYSQMESADQKTDSADDIPGYRKATGAANCLNCDHGLNRSSTDTLYCEKYDEVVAGDWVCDAWGPAAGDRIDETVFTDKELHQQATAWAKRQYAKWPSAYGSAALTKKYRELYAAKHGSTQGAFREDGLEQWFAEDWVRISSAGDILGPCGDRSENEGTPKCLDRARAESMTKAERAAAVRRKREADPNPDREGKAINVATKADDAAPAKRIVKFHDFQIGLQYFPFEKRHGKVLKAGYGHFRKTKGADGMAVDCYVGPNLDSPKVFSIDQLINGQFDEEKMVIGVERIEDAIAIYTAAMPREMLGGIREISLDDLRKYKVDYETKADADPFQPAPVELKNTAYFDEYITGIDWDTVRSIADDKGWTWDAEAGQYRDGSQLASANNLTDTINAEMAALESQVDEITTLLENGDVDVAEWEELLAELTAATAALFLLFGLGGDRTLATEGQQVLEEKLRTQFEFLRSFSESVLLGAMTIGGIAARAKLYPHDAQLLFNEGQEIIHPAEEWPFASNILGSCRHCRECPILTAQGIVPRGEMPKPGQRECRTRCCCHLVFHRTRNDGGVTILDLGQGWL